MTEDRRVAIHYRRPPDHVRIYDQRVVLERRDVVVTVADDMQMDAPLVMDDRVALEAGSTAVWFTFPRVWHDIGLFHLADGTFTGLYANVLTPPEMNGGIWHTTDLYLDVWWPTGGQPLLRDEDELDQALAEGLVEAVTAERARFEARTILAKVEDGRWPPPIVEDWTLERIRERDQARA